MTSPHATHQQIWATKIATLFGVGNAPFAPGTFGSIAALIPGAAIWILGGVWLLLIATIISVAVGVYTAELASRQLDDKDPKSVVIDELSGQWLTLFIIACFLSFSLIAPIAAFLAFRLFDITKPPPINSAEKFAGGWGIMADDLVAGVFAGALVVILSVLAAFLGL